MAKKTLWGGRFSEPLDEFALKFSSSIEFDKLFYREDIAGSIAHVEMLSATRILSKSEARKIKSALKVIQKEIETGKFRITDEYEDIHSAIEQRLIEKIGPLGGKLHTARSRNDQVALDERLFLKNAISVMFRLITGLQRILLGKAEQLFDVIMPGYTHTQRAQPILLSHHLLAYIYMLDRDYARLQDCLKRVNKSPLGAAALAGTSFPIDRELVAKKLGFDGIIENSIDAVSDRDYIIEFVSCCSIIAMHLSRLAEELVLWTTKEFGFAEISDKYTTGSSIMPQKKNSDLAELIRGKTGTIYGSLVNILTTMKALPLAYNRDMQQDKQPMFEAFKITGECLLIMAQLFLHTCFNKQRLEEELRTDFLTATDMADYLVTKGVPFREAHRITGEIVKYCMSHKMFFGNLDLNTLREFSPKFDADIFEYILPKNSVQRKMSAGSTSPKEVKKQINYWKLTLQKRR